MDEQAMDETALSVARTRLAAAAFRVALRDVRNKDIATPIECANAMMITAVMMAFVAAAGEPSGYEDSVELCIAEVTKVINRHLMGLAIAKERGAK